MVETLPAERDVDVENETGGIPAGESIVITEMRQDRHLWLAEMLSAESGIDPFSPQARTLSLHLSKSSFG